MDYNGLIINQQLKFEFNMYPYFAPNPAFITPPAPQYGYAPPNGFIQPQQMAPQVINSIESMYTTVQPYMNKEFLLATFGSKPEYIQIFLSLPHQDKLKMYLLMEEKKIYGEMTDKEGYQKILREIAQKMQNYNNFHQTKQQKVEDSNEKKKKELQSKIDSFCQTSFQKLQITHLGENKPTPTENKKYVEIEDVDQWVQSTVVQQNSTTQDVAKSGGGIEDFSFLTPHEGAKQNMTSSSSYSPNNQAPIIFNMFSFDSQMERAMTKEIGLKDTEKLSIWEMELSETEVKNNEPKLSEVFKKKDSVMEAQQNQAINIPQKKSNQAEQMSFDIFGHYPTYPAAEYIENNNNLLYTSQQSTGFNAEQLYNRQSKDMSQPVADSSLVLDYITPLSNYLAEAPVQVQFNHNDHFENAEAKLEQQEQQWTQQVTYETAAEQTNNLPEIVQTYQQAYQVYQQTNPAYQQPPQQSNYYNIAEQTKTVEPSQSTQTTQYSDNLFDFQILESKVETPLISQQTADLFLSSHGPSKTELPEVQSHEDYRIQLPEIPQEIIQTVVDLDAQPNTLMNSQLYLPQNDKKYEIIQNLKIQFSQSQRAFLKKQLKNKSFQCNTQFYLIILNHLRQVGLESTNQFQHFSEQYKIAKEIHELTAMYTAVVDEEDEQKVQRALRQTKALYNQIYNKSTISEKFVQHLLSDKNKQKGVYFKFGKVLIDSCINSELISRASNQQNQENIFNSFCLLFILEKNNSLNKLKGETELIITFTNQEIDRFKSYNEQLFRQAEQSMDQDNCLLVYIRGLLKIVSLCERMINLMKSCSIKSSSNLVKTLKNCKDTKNRFSRYQQGQSSSLFPSEYGRLLRYCIQKNYSLYDLHVKFSELAQKMPVCQICLTEINNQGTQHEEKGWYHFSCYNLMKGIDGLDYL